MSGGSMFDRPAPRPACLLVGVQLPGISDEQHQSDLAELGRLVHTLGLEVVATVTQKRDSLSPGGVVGGGKLREIARWTGGSGVVPSGARPKRQKGAHANRRDEDEAEEPDFDADDADDGDDAGELDGRPPARKATIVVVDHEISPTQARNLERATDAEVMDRTGVIVEIFHRHARSREAKLQVEIARLNYVAPRMRESGGGGDRQRGGIGGKGAGESALELDRRKIRDRIAELRRELESIAKEQQTRRAARKDARRVALVGYTNAGKSSLMRALTGSDVLVADKLFATLDTTVRAIHPPAHPKILASDTVGFIKKLPHDLVASFKSTLDEALEASLLLYVVDASDPTHEQQLDVTKHVLREIGADVVPSLLVMNKMDRLSNHQTAVARKDHPDAIFLSAKAPDDVARLRQTIIDWFEAGMEEGDLTVPYAKRSLMGEVYECARVLEETWDEVGAQLKLKAPEGVLARLRSAIAR
jgi:GTP-binding protein HflX